jgi:hypothetical protein
VTDDTPPVAVQIFQSCARLRRNPRRPKTMRSRSAAMRQARGHSTAPIAPGGSAPNCACPDAQWDTQGRAHPPCRRERRRGRSRRSSKRQRSRRGKNSYRQLVRCPPSPQSCRAFGVRARMNRTAPTHYTISLFLSLLSSPLFLFLTCTTLECDDDDAKLRFPFQH